MTETAAEISPSAEEPETYRSRVDPSETWQIEVDHSSYYRMVPVSDADVFDDTPDEEGLRPELPEGKTALSRTVAATWPGFRMHRVLVEEPTTTTTGVHVASLASENDDRAAASLGPRSLSALLIRHLEDGPWPKHFPLDSITAVRCSEPKVEARLRSYFLDEA